MIRPLLQEVLIFLIPFLIYVVYLVATRAGVLHPQSWPLMRVAWLTIVALVLAIVSLFLLADLSGAPPGSTYVPAHVEGGKLVPGMEKR
jgi:hypothetical protein